jgi:hypothetical protein
MRFLKRWPHRASAKSLAAGPSEEAPPSREYSEFNESVKESGHFIGANRLKPSETATTVRVRNGKVFVTDGPFAETKEQIGGCYLIEAKNLDEAISPAAKIPGARIGCVELRPIADDAQTLALGFDVPHANKGEETCGN